MTASMKLMLALVIILLMGAGFYLFDWSARWERRQSATESLRARQTQLQSLKKALLDLPELQQRVAAAQARLDRSISGQRGNETSEDMVPNVVSDLEQLVCSGADPGLRIHSLAPAGPGALREDLPPVPNRVFTLALQGRYQSLTALLYQLGDLRLNRLVTINSLRLSKSGDGNGLAIDLPVTAYQR